MADEKAVCEVCGEPMPPGEEVFKYHGYSGPCPKPPLPKPAPAAVGMTDQQMLAEIARLRAEVAAYRDGAEDRKESLAEKLDLVREQRDKLLRASKKALAMFDTALVTKGVGSPWSSKDVDEVRAVEATIVEVQRQIAGK